MNHRPRPVWAQAHWDERKGLDRYVSKYTGVGINYRTIMANLCANWTHFISRGALLGINQQLDCEVAPNYPAMVLTGLLLFVFILLTHGPLQMGLILLLINPVWLYALPDIPDVVMENRGIWFLLPLSVVSASLAQFAPWACLMTLSAVWFAMTTYRNGFWSSRITFWERASKETPNKLRPQVNYTVQLSTKPDRLEEAMTRYENLLRRPETTKEISLCCSNLFLLYIKCETLTSVPEEKHHWLRQAALLLEYGIEKWPEHELIRFNRGRMFMMFSQWELAIKEFNISITSNPRNAYALVARARCYGQLGNRDQAQRDGDLAERIDGVKRITRKVDAQGVEMEA